MNVEAQWEAVEVIFRNSMLCHKCFEQHLVEASLVDIAQPRWIWENYFSAAMRVVVVGLNPGAGNTRDKEKANRPFRQVLYAYRDGMIGLPELFDFQRQYIPQWGTPPGRFVRFYMDGMGLKLDSIALVNIAWCSDVHNRYPKRMLSQCFRVHTIGLLQNIYPDMVVLSGVATHDYANEIRRVLPNCRVVKTWHYAHRKRQQAERIELLRVKNEIATCKSSLCPTN
jgi:hypothetical protein